MPKPKYGILCDGFSHDGLTHSQMIIIPDVDILCAPPYLKGKKNSLWVSYRTRPNMENKHECEVLAGMSLQPLIL